MRILFVAPYIPSLVRVRPYNLIRALAAAGHSLHLVLLRPPEDRDVPIEPLRAAAEAVDCFPLARLRTLVNAALALPGRLPLQAAYSRHPAAARRVRQLAATGRFEVLHVEHLRGAVLAEGVPGLPCVFDSVDSITYLFEQARHHAPYLGQRLLAALDLARTREYEEQIPFRFAHTLVTSPVDRQAFERLAGSAAGSRISVLPNGVDLAYFQPTAAGEPATILFSGKLSYHANAAAALFLARDIMPRVWEKHPEARLILAGKDPSAGLRALAADPRITLTGDVPDLRPYFARATLAAAPLLYGAGVQNKVLEAMACGLPVVVTPLVLAALQAEPGRDLLTGADTAELAGHVISIIEQPALRQALAAAGRRYVEAHHDWAAIARDLTAVYERVRAV